MEILSLAGDVLNIAFIVWYFQRLVARIDAHGKQINDHETRITVLEKT